MRVFNRLAAVVLVLVMLFETISDYAMEQSDSTYVGSLGQSSNEYNINTVGEYNDTETGDSELEEGEAGEEGEEWVTK